MQKTKFKQTEIGMIPKDWEIKELKEIAPYINEKISLDEIDIKSFISTENMLPDKNGITIASSLPKVGKVTQFKEGDILFSNIRTYFKKLWLAKFSGGCSNDVLVIRGKYPINNKYLYYFLSQNKFFEFTVLTSKGTKMPRGDKNAIMGYNINIPSINEQQVIAKILSNLDSKIELNQQMNKTLEAIGQAIFKHWFVDFDFPNEKGKPYKSSGGEMVDSELGEIPKGWEIGKLPEVAIVTDCLHTKKPKQKYDGDMLLQFYNLTDEHGINISNPYYISKEDYTVWTKNILVKEGDLLFTNAGGQKIARVPYWFKGGIGRNITAVRGNKINVAYLFYYFLSSYGNNQTNKNTDAGTIFSSLNVKGIRNISILIPPKEITDNFSRMASKICSKIETNDINKYNLSQIRDSLLPRLMSGKIRVPVEVRT